MDLDPRQCYRALVARDARFDGRFFTAVRTTGVYCRPVCPAPTPKLENCTFLPSAAAAQERGFRPCLRCRPEASPGTPTWLGTSAAVSRALRLIGAGALNAEGVGGLARRLGMSERHLRRLFEEHLGASPVTVAATQRVHFAKKLIDETAMPITEIAFAAGYASVRRFNDAIRSTYGRAPRELRRSCRKGAPSGLVIKLGYRPPFRWRAIASYLAGRSTPGVEVADARGWRRTIRLGQHTGWIEVQPVVGANQLLVGLHGGQPAVLIDTAERVRRVFDLGADPRGIAESLRRDPHVGPLLRRLPGLRVPGAWDGFELAVRAIVGQQVSVRAATTIQGRIAAAAGEPVPPEAGWPSELKYVFPRPETLAEARLERVGLPSARARTISRLARAVADGALSLDPAAPYEATIERLESIPGIGDWTAQYIAMRALAYPDAFPSGDLGLRKALSNGAGSLLAAASLAEIAEAWRPWRAYAAMCLWQGRKPA